MSLAAYTSYRRLWGYVILQALRDSRSPHSFWRLPAIEWLQDQSYETGSLAWICDLFDINFEQIHRTVYTEEGRRSLLRAGWSDSDSGDDE